MKGRFVLVWVLNALGLYVIGTLIGLTVMVALLAYDSAEVPIIFGAKWWEVMTAIGTVGSVLAALWFSLREVRVKRKATLKGLKYAVPKLEGEAYSMYESLHYAVSALEAKAADNEFFSTDYSVWQRHIQDFIDSANSMDISLLDEVDDPASEFFANFIRHLYSTLIHFNLEFLIMRDGEEEFFRDIAKRLDRANAELLRFINSLNARYT